MTVSQALSWLSAQIGQHLDYDHEYGQQCFDFFNFYYQFISGDGPYADGYAVPDAKDIWGIANNRFTKIPNSNTLVPQPGDVAIYGASWGAGDGHVEVVIQTTDTGCYFVGENEHGNTTEGVVKVFRTWAQMDGLIGVMRYQWVTTQPEPTPAMYQVVETYSPAKQVKLNKQPTYLWGMNYDLSYMVNHPVEMHNAGEIWDIDNKVLHQDGSYYYRRPGQIDGFNVVDCDDYTPPAPTPDPTPVQEAPAPPETNTLPPVTTPPVQEPPKVTAGPSKPVVVSVPPKVIVPEPHLYYTLWQLFVAIIKKLFGVK